MAEEKKPLVTRMRAGKEVEIPLEECWDSICKVIRIARLLTSPGGEQYEATRLAFLAERMSDLQDLSFNYKSNPFSINLSECFVPGPRK